MPIKAIVLGLPRSGTTAVYKELCLEAKKRFNALCIFEPTNFEVVNNIYRGIKHVHDVVGEVPYDYDKLPTWLFAKIHANTWWHIEWMKFEKPRSPFCGWMWREILHDLDSLHTAVIIKDVHLWVFADRLVHELRGSRFILTLPSWGRWSKSIEKRFRLVSNELDKAGIGKFYRFYNDLNYLKPSTIGNALKEAAFVYGTYWNIVEKVRDMDNVYVLRFEEQLTPEQIRRAVEWALR